MIEPKRNRDSDRLSLRFIWIYVGTRGRRGERRNSGWNSTFDLLLIRFLIYQGNWGLYDQRTAMQWAQKWAPHFAADVNSVSLNIIFCLYS